MFCRVTVRSGPGSGDGCVIADKSVLSFGRLRANDCVLSNDAAISRRHFEISFEDGACWIADTKSRNGTFVNDSSVHRAPLQNGDEILVGNTRLLVRLEKQTQNTLVSEINERSRPVVRIDPNEVTSVPAPRRSPGYWLESLVLDRKSVCRRPFVDLLNDFPGTAFLVNEETWKGDRSLLEDMESLPVTKQSRLFFANNSNQLEQCMDKLIGDDSAFLICSRARRSQLVNYLQGSLDAFRRPSRFLSDYVDVPKEVLANHLQGIAVLMVESAPNKVRIFYRPGSDPAFAKELSQLI